MTECYCPKCGNKGSLTYDKETLESGKTVKYWKVGHKGTENRSYCYLGREKREVQLIKETGLENKTIGDK